MAQSVSFPVMENWNDFLARYKREHDLNQSELAERLNMTQGGVGHWLRGTRRPTLKTINQKLEVLGLVYLQAQVMVAERRELREAQGDYGSGDTPIARAMLHACFRFPVLAWAQLEGELPDTAEHTGQTDYTPKGKGYWLPVENDAMNASSGVSVPKGSRVLVDSGLEATPGRIVIARQPGKAPVMRRLIEADGERLLEPLNTRYPTVLCEPDCQFLGVVVRLYGEL